MRVCIVTMDYSKALLYSITCRDPMVTDAYVGGTCNFTVRKNAHARAASGKGKGTHYAVYETIRKHGGWPNWQMQMIERWPCASKAELDVRERFHIERLGASLNMRLPAHTTQEYRQKNREKNRARCAKWYQENKERAITATREYAQSHPEIQARRKERMDCPCGGRFRRGDIARHLRSQMHVNWQFAQDLEAFIYS
jgi:hypothetical protein